MSLVYNEEYFIPFDKSQIDELSLEKMEPNELNEYYIEKNFFSDKSHIKRTDLYPSIKFLNNDKEKIESLNYSKNYIVNSKGFYDLDGEYFFLERKKINFIIFMINNEIKIRDLNELLFYIINSKKIDQNLISITSIICSYNYGLEYHPVYYFHDKPYHFYDDYASKNKEEYDNFIKTRRYYSLNLFELNNNNIIEDLKIHTSTLPIFIIYDRNYRILYKDNLFQETPESLDEISSDIYDNINDAYNPKNYKPLGKPCPITISTFFDKIEKMIKEKNIFNNKEEFNQENKILTSAIRDCLKNDNYKNDTYKVYFVKKYQGLSQTQFNNLTTDNISSLDNEQGVNINYLKPIVISPDNNFPDFLNNNDYCISFPYLFRNNLNFLIHYTWKCALSYCENNHIKNSEFQFKTIKTVSNLGKSISREFNVIYNDGFDLYFIPFNFKTLFMDKSKYFNINLRPKLVPSQKYKLKFKDFNTKEKEIEIKRNEITIFQYFREDLYLNQFDLSEKINQLKAENPNIKFKYYIVILIACDKFKNSIYFDKVINFLNQCISVDCVLFYTYVINEFHELTKYLTNGPSVYIFSLKKEMTLFEIVPDDKEKNEQLLEENVNKLLAKSYERKITRQQYKAFKNITKDFMKLKKNYKDKVIIEMELSKTKFFDEKENLYLFKFYNYERKVWDINKRNGEKNEINDIKQKIQNILDS